MNTARNGCATKNARNPRNYALCVRAGLSMLRVKLKIGDEQEANRRRRPFETLGKQDAGAIKGSNGERESTKELNGYKGEKRKQIPRRSGGLGMTSSVMWGASGMFCAKDGKRGGGPRCGVLARDYKSCGVENEWGMTDRES